MKSHSNIEALFDGDRTRLADCCERIASALFSIDPHSTKQLRQVAAVLRDTSDWDAQARAAASLRGLFHRDGLDDRPPPADARNWDEDLKTLWDLSTIYVETKYCAVAAMRGTI